MPRVGYLLPTRERVMEGRDETGSLLALAEKAEGLGYDSLWVGDSLLARPRHDPLTRLAASLADRVFVLAYDDPWPKLMLDADPPTDQEWLLASQMKIASLDGRPVFRALPRDEAAVASAVASRGAVKGSLGKAYDELADLLVIDAT